MKVVIEKRLTEDGYVKWSIEIDGKKSKFNYLASRRLTGVEREEGMGIFTQTSESCTLWYGKYKKTFPTVILSESKSATEVAEDIKKIVKEVQEWIKKCKAKAYTQTIEFVITDPE